MKRFRFTGQASHGLRGLGDLLIDPAHVRLARSALYW
jgi:hypothetical protein